MGSVPPAFVFLAGAAAMALCGRRAQPALLLIVPIAGAVNLAGLADGEDWRVDILDYTLTLLRVDRLSFLFGVLFHLAAFIAGLFALHQRDRLQHSAAMLYVGSALGAVFAGDLVSLFLFSELLAVGGALVVLAGRSAAAMSAAFRYFVIHVLAGALLLVGAILHIRATGSSAFGAIGLDGLGGWLILLAFAIKCAFPLVHNWLTDSYPQATATGTVFLAAFTTKVAVYALARGFAGAEPLIYVGTVMTLFPIFYAVIENDLRRVLSYSMINQLGFMVAGIGLGSALALDGALAHAFNEVLFKGLLLMAMGAVLHVTGTTRCSDLGGLYKTMPATATFCIVGAVSISAFPLFNGFVSKSLIMAAALEEGYDTVWLLLLFASAGVLHHAGIKVPFNAFFATDRGVRAKEPPANMLWAMAVAAALCVAIGSYPALLYGLLPIPVEFVPYDRTHVLVQLQLLAFAVLAAVVLKLADLEPHEVRSVLIDAEWFYRRLGPRLLARLVRGWAMLAALAREAGGTGGAALADALWRLAGPSGTLARTWSVGLMVLVTAAALALSLALYLLL